MEELEITPEQEEGRVITLSTPYLFEGKEYTTIDLNGLDKLTIGDAVDAQKDLFSESEAAAAVICETTTAFARVMAAKATGLPIEFFKLAPRRVSRRVAAAVRSAITAEKEVKNHVMEFDKPYVYKGETYTEVDLNAVADLNSLNESEAENRMVRAGFVITETSFNYLYGCILASMATRKPEDFFTGLPLAELLKLKNAVNDSGFFE